MTPIPQDLREVQAEMQGRQDEEHLRLLTLFHTIAGGLTILFSCIFLIHTFLGLMMVTNPGFFGPPSPTNVPPPPSVGYLFLGMGGLAVILGWTLGGLTVYAGRCIKARKHWLFILIIAGVSCLNTPIGTVLGVFTFVVLLRPSVKTLFEARDSVPAAPGRW